jgi:hypothetical protein
MEGQVPVFISPRNRVAQLYPWALGNTWRFGCPSHIHCQLAGHSPIEIGAAMLRTDWLDGGSIEDWHLEYNAMWEVPKYASTKALPVTFLSISKFLYLSLLL